MRYLYRPLAARRPFHALGNTRKRPVPGVPDHQCRVSGLEYGGCFQRRLRNPDGTFASAYCFYHDKVRRGLTEPEMAEVYPVLPLPPHGYILVNEEEVA